MEVDFQRATCPVFDSTVNCVRIQTFIIQYSPHPWSCLRKRQASENTFEFIFLLFKNCDYDDCVCGMWSMCIMVHEGRSEEKPMESIFCALT